MKNNSLKIGSFEIPTRVFLAPMAGCTDLSFRLIAREHGAKFCFFEMVDCNSITYGPKRKVLSILKTLEEDRPIAAQLLGRNPSKMLAGAKEILEVTKPSFLDINAACPVKKAVKKKTGAYLLKDGKTLCKIIKTLALALPVPVTVKIRTGYDTTDLNDLTKLVKGCELSGAEAIFIHGRTRVQGYSGEIDYAAIRAVKESVHIPVIGSGNIFDAISAKKMFKETGCDAIAVARGALGNPWIFREIEDSIKGNDEGCRAGLLVRRSLGEGGNPPYICIEDRIGVLKKHLVYIEKYRDCGPSGAVGFMRKVALWYLRGFHAAASIRCRISVVKSYEEMIELINTIGK